MTGNYVVQDDAFAMIWVWDDALRQKQVNELTSAGAEEPSRIENLTVVPEPLLLARSEEGVVEKPVAKGIDVQRWQSGKLVSSSYLPAEAYPSDEKNNRASLNAPSWLVETNAAKTGLPEVYRWRAGLWLLLLISIFVFSNLLGWLANVSALESRLQEAQVGAQQIVEARNEARSAKEKADLLQDSINYPSQLWLLAEFDAHMPDSAVYKSWSFTEDSLSVTVEDPDLDNREFIQSLEASDRFVDVRVEPGSAPDSAIIKLRLIE